ncbi:DEAD/DEAH box helicase [sulfur-oxidizing endosymbiont of Gigantopelta aegis]|uniref:DEAD/DEAH box helicase n=1 Tax=sulfur-oxidizing endosymbiont of Gigantopelta aegis TaxID=2794934 RepID=UPI0018DB36EE|nr:DEAD/DEAH box helicase [sulfur-oxidizing endosymbiont of Gigantopelta aegis]
MSSAPNSNELTFDSLDLIPPILKAVNESGYTKPSDIQAQSIPFLLAGRDIIGQAQTGTGKTAAFALPILCNIEVSLKKTQVLVLAPTRELAIQVAEAFQTYAKHLPKINIVPVYGGAPYSEQLRGLKKGAHIVVGTPGRVMDHIRKGSLNLSGLQTLVLDEADEMLRMGFIDDVEWVLEQSPESRQIALFSATMPTVIRRIAQKYLVDPEIVKVVTKTVTASTIRQRYWRVYGASKLDALTRILELEDHDAMLVFVNTKNMTLELAEQLQTRGFACEALNGDIPQSGRERIVERLKRGRLDVLIATDVVARGLDVQRISHVVNYDAPRDNESYVHRIGRTGRAGREGDAILFVSRRETRLLKSIEKTTKQVITEMEIPSVKNINELRVTRYKKTILSTIEKLQNSKDFEVFTKLIGELHETEEVDTVSIAAALAHMGNNNKSFLLNESEFKHLKDKRPFKDDYEDRGSRKQRGQRGERKKKEPIGNKATPLKGMPDVEMKRFRVEVGYDHGVKPGNIVGAIANEAGLDSKLIGQIEIFDGYSVVDLPDGMPKDVFQDLQKAWVCQQQLKITAFAGGAASSPKSDNFKKRSGKGRKTNNRAHQQRKSKD